MEEPKGEVVGPAAVAIAMATKLIEQGNFLGAREALLHDRSKTSPGDQALQFAFGKRLTVDPVAILVGTGCAVSLAIVAALTLFY